MNKHPNEGSIHLWTRIVKDIRSISDLRDWRDKIAKVRVYDGKGERHRHESIALFNAMLTAIRHEINERQRDDDHHAS
jgi:hypothetical protein